MGDDEFFSTTTGTTTVRDPLNIDDLVIFSRKLLNLAFALYWRDDQLSVQEGGVPGLNVKWEAARETITRCLLAIHARE
jgi:ubiquitin-protein ligase E3 C